MTLTSWRAPQLALAFAAQVTLVACGAADTSPNPAPTQNERSSMMVIRVLVEIQPDQVDAFIAHLDREAVTVRQMDGCDRYDLFRDPSSPNRFLLYEEWATPAAFEAYRQSELLRESFAVLGPMMAGPPDSSYFEATPQAQ